MEDNKTNFQYGILSFPLPDKASHRRILHVDMDAFYASVEIRDNNSLRGKAVVIARHPKETNGRGIVSTCNYIARQYGIHSAMSAQEAYERCKEAVFIPPRHAYYREVSQQIREIFKRFTDKIEVVSVDEAYLDVTTNFYQEASAQKIGQKIQYDIYKELHLTCSVGVSYNKFLAKIASDYEKPAGLTVIPAETAEEFLEKLAIGKFHGVGKSLESKLLQAGVSTGKELKALSYADLVDHYGKMGRDLFFRVRGIDRREVKASRKRKSIGKERTFAPILLTHEELYRVMKEMTEEVEALVDKYQVNYKTVAIKFRYKDFSTHSKQTPFVFWGERRWQLYRVAKGLIDEVIDVNRGIRLLGVTVMDFDELIEEQVNLPLDDKRDTDFTKK